MTALFYDTIGEVWGSEPITIGDLGQFQEADYFRTVAVANIFQQRHATEAQPAPTGIPAYIDTLQNIRDAAGDGDPAPDASTSSLGTIAKNAVFPTDIFGLSTADLAHLIPHGKTAVLSYWFVIPFLFNTPAAQGVQGDIHNHWTRNQCSRLLNGTLNRTGISRISGTGLKHLNLNKISLHGQEKHYDDNPHIIIVPIMRIEEMRDYDGTRGYEAIVVTGANSGFVDIDEAEADVGTRDKVIQSLTLLALNKMYNGPQADQDELVTATNLLRNMLRAILKVKHNRMSDDIEVNHQYERQQTFLPVFNPNGVENLCVAKIGFGGPNDAGLHPAPDPVLLTVKAAVNYSRRHDMPLAAQAEPQEDDEWGELDQLAAEEYMEWRESLIKPPDNFHDLAAGLGQRDAARPDDWGIDTTTTSTTHNRDRGYHTLMPNVRALLDLE